MSWRRLPSCCKEARDSDVVKWRGKKLAWCIDVPDDDNHDCFVAVPIRFCPFCGKPLKENDDWKGVAR